MRKRKRKHQSPDSYVFPFKGRKVSLTCPECKNRIRVPSWVIKDFSPGGKEYHPGGTSSIVCPICRGLIKIS